MQQRQSRARSSPDRTSSLGLSVAIRRSGRSAAVRTLTHARRGPRPSTEPGQRPDQPRWFGERFHRAFRDEEASTELPRVESSGSLHGDLQGWLQTRRGTERGSALGQRGRGEQTPRFLAGEGAPRLPQPAALKARRERVTSPPPERAGGRRRSPCAQPSPAPPVPGSPLGTRQPPGTPSPTPLAAHPLLEAAAGGGGRAVPQLRRLPRPQQAPREAPRPLAGHGHRQAGGRAGAPRSGRSSGSGTGLLAPAAAARARARSSPGHAQRGGPAPGALRGGRGSSRPLRR